MTKNSNKVLEENDEVLSTYNILLQVESRPKIASPLLQVSTVLHALRTLDVIKGGLVCVRGGHFLDHAFIILENDNETEQLFKSVSQFFDAQLIRPGGCSKFFQNFFYKPTRKAVRSRKSVRTGSAGVVEEDIPNENYIETRYIVRIPLPSAASAVYFVQSYLEVVLDALNASDLPASIVMAAYKKCSSWTVENFVSYAKYCTAYPFAKYLKQADLPKKPEGLNSFKVFDGAIGKMIRARLVSNNDKCKSFFFSILQGVKRACNVVPSVYIEQSKIKHLSTLTKRTESIDEKTMSSFTYACNVILHGVSLTERKILSFTEPSKNASLDFSRKFGGQETDVRLALDFPVTMDSEASAKVVEIRYPEPEDHPDSIPLVMRLVYSSGFLEDKSPPFLLDPRSFEQVLSLNSFYNSLEMDGLYLMGETDTGIKELRGTTLSQSDKRRILSQAIKETGSDPLECNIVPLSEPLKVRTISAGSGLVYYLSKPFQKTLWKFLRRFPQFIVIGEPLTRIHLCGILDRERDLVLYFEQRVTSKSNTVVFEAEIALILLAVLFLFWVSGDYSAATDNLKIEYTLGAFDIVAANMILDCKSRSGTDEELALLTSYLDLIRKALEPHLLWYNDRNDKLEEFCKTNNISYMKLGNFLGVRQENGQLMGSPISFPFLCLINFVGYWISLCRFLGTTVPFRLLPVLVNGDDILFRSNDQHYRVWKDVIAELGFQLSLGKNYTHKTMLTINSELYEHDVRDPLEFRKLEFFNVGLLIAQSKGRLADPRRKLPLCDLYIESVGHALNRVRAHRRFLHYNRIQIIEMTDRGKYNLFLPLEYGGLGFQVYDEVRPEIRITKFQRRFASFLLYKVTEGLSKGKFLRRYFCALLSDNTPIRSILLKAGNPELKLGGLVPDEGWKLFNPNPAKTAGPFSFTQEIVSDPDMTYRYPAKSVLRQFNRTQFQLRSGELTDSLLCRAMSNEELLSSGHLFVHQRQLFSKEDPTGPLS